MSKKREREHSQDYGDVNAENVDVEECQAEAAGACDCKRCIKKILLNANLLWAHGYHVDIDNNGPGGYGFDVQTTMEVLHDCFEDPDKLRDENWTCVTNTLTQDQINKMIKEVVEDGHDVWTPHCTPEEMRTAWRRWFHLLK